MTVPHQLLLVDCRDEPGLIYKITGVVFGHGCNIVRNQEFVDAETGRFFMRTELTGVRAAAELLDELQRVLPAESHLRLAPSGDRRIVVLVTREHHCLGELLLAHASNELGAKIEAVIGNHAALEPLVGRFGVPFHHLSHEGISRPEHEERLAELVASYDPEYIVLAKYMRVLGPEFVGRYVHRIINIHHSFLPAFVGSQPYRQAFERGVKIIGATAHFVTESLDEGPIIAQNVIPVDHTYTPATMARAGRDVEKLVLARALRLVFDERVLLVGNRTIVFD
ncbi:MAG: formyltetrahydrofolate deformylase [Gemmatimonadetes bacterium]|nr:formyltetrahydrofolate deformylase [Gemmatimonadota bacterium]